jgi:hypothetical protein
MQDAYLLRSLTRVVAMPSADRDFARFVEDCLSPVPNVATLESRLRARYPRARVQISELSGRDAVWYAYRDGRWQLSAAAPDG